MAIEFFPVIEGQERDELIIFDGGKSISHCSDQLEKIAAEIQVPPLEAFFNMSRAEAIESLDEDAVEETESEAEETADGWFLNGAFCWTREARWFPAEEGLKTVRSLAAYLREHPEVLEEGVTGPLIVLQEIKELLEQAHSEGKGFHMSCSF